MFRIYIIISCLLLSLELQSKESLLTLKQQLDRLQREVSDLSESVYKNAEKNKSVTVKNIGDQSNLTAFDLRIYDLEKDIQKLNENFEELIFQIDDLNELYKKLQNKNSLNILENDNENKIIDLSENKENISSDNKNTLGTLVIKTEDLTDVSNEVLIEVEGSDSNLNTQKKGLVELKPEEEFQKAFDMIRNQKFIEAKEALKVFINKYQNNKLSGSAHYWLGEIYFLKKEYREAALILAEGYQNYPDSFKAPDMLFKLSDSLSEIDKKKDACATLEKLISEFPENNLAFKAKKNLISFNCNITE